MGSRTTSPSLLSRVRDPADRLAWREFDAKYGQLIVRFCRGRHIQLADAEDIRQMVMARLARTLGKFRYARQRGRFRTYLGRITRNEIIRYFARPKAPARRVEKDVDAAEPAVADLLAEARWEQEWVHHHLRLAMRSLRETYSPRSLAVFERLVEGETVEQVATTFGMTDQAVHKVKQRVRDRLKTLVAAQIRQEDQPPGDAAHGPSAR